MLVLSLLSERCSDIGAVIVYGWLIFRGQLSIGVELTVNNMNVK